MMEIDPTIRQTVASLLSIVRVRPGAVVQALASAMDTLAKVSEGASGGHYQATWGSRDYPPE